MAEVKIRKKQRNQKKRLEKAENALIYNRVSSDEQAKKGYSLDAQEEECIKFAKTLNYNVLKIFREEGQSAKNLNRKELQKLLKYCKENKNQVKYVIIWKLDRLTRKLSDLLKITQELDELGITILSATEPNESGAAGNLNRNFLGVMAQYDNELKSERVVLGMKKALKSGRWQWKAQYGYIYDKNLRNIKPKKGEKEVVQMIFEKYATGCYSQVDILTELKQRGIKINPNRLCEMLRNHIYCGYIYKEDWVDEPIKGTFTPIISVELFNKVQDILDGKKPSIAPHDMENEDYPLKQFLVCPYCGKALTGSNSISQRGKKLYQYYACYNKECPSKNKEISKSKFNVSKDVAENHFMEVLSSITPKDEVVEMFKDMVKDIYTEQTSEAKSISDNVKKELEQLQGRKKELVDRFIDNRIDQAIYDMKIAEYNELELNLKTKLQNDCPSMDEFDKFLTSAMSIVQNIQKTWYDSDCRIKKCIQKLIFPNGLSADFQSFQNSLNSIIFTKIGALTAPYIDKLPPREFESLSTP